MERGINALDAFELRLPQPSRSDWALRNLINAALLFTLDQHLPRAARGAGQPPGPPGDAEDELHRHARDYYFDRFFDLKGLYVRREALTSQLSGTRRSDRYAVLRGPRGSGKSTLLRHYCRSENGDEGVAEVLVINPRSAQTSVFYIDLKRSEKILLDRAVGEHRVCEVVYSRLTNRFLGAGTEDELSNEQLAAVRDTGSAWDEFVFRHSPSHKKLLESIGRDRVRENRDESLWEIANTEHRALIRTLDIDFAKQPAEIRLRLFLEFLHNVYGHVPVVLIDNVDRYTIPLHSTLNRTVSRIAHSPDVDVRFVLAMRNSTAKVILDQHEEERDGMIYSIIVGDQEDLIAKDLLDDSRWNEFDELVSMSSPPKGQTGMLSDGFFSGVVVRRLRALESFIESTDRDQFSDGTASLPSATQVSDLGLKVVELLLRHRNEHTHLGFKQTLLRWHNYSIRSALAHQFRIYSSITTGFDVLFPSPLGAPETRFTEPSAHDFRTLIWRHIIFGDSRTLAEPTGVTPNLVDRQVHGKLMMPFPTLIILQYISHTESCDLGKLRGAMLQFGIQRGVVDSALDGLTASRGFETEGLVGVDGTVYRPTDEQEWEEMERLGRRSVGELKDSRAVKLRPAGRFFLQWIAPSCEYLFWCAMLTEDRRGIDIVQRAAGDVEKDESLIARDWFRATVAVDYLCEVVAPIELEFLESNLRLSKDSADHFRRKLASLTKTAEWHGEWSYVARASRGLSGFVRSAAPDEMPSSRRRYIDERIAALRLKLSDAQSSCGIS